MSAGELACTAAGAARAHRAPLREAERPSASGSPESDAAVQRGRFLYPDIPLQSGESRRAWRRRRLYSVNFI